MKKITRRSFLAAAGLSVAALALTACGGASSSVASSVASSAAASSEAASTSAAAGELTTVEAGKLTMATNATFPPYEMTTDSGEFEGIDIDTAKAIAIGVPYDGDFWDFFSGKMPEQALPVGTVLTIAASGSEGSPDSIITNEKTLEKNGAEADCLRPCFSVLDPALTESLPAYQTACGITDIMAHTFERYFTNTPDVEVTDRMLEGVLLAMLHEGRRVMEDPHNYEARANIMWAGMVCHNDIMGVGRQQDWNSHHLEHVLSAKYDCAHGAGLAVIMPAWMRYCAEHGGEKRLAQMAVRVFGCQMDFDDPKRTALEGIEAFRAFLRSIGMPLTFAEIGADPADIPELVEMNRIGDGKTGGYIGLDRQAHFDIYNLAAGNCVPEN